VAVCLIDPASPQSLLFVYDGRVLIGSSRYVRIFSWRPERSLEGNRP
jgi:hypothetical protein